VVITHFAIGVLGRDLFLKKQLRPRIRENEEMLTAALARISLEETGTLTIEATFLSFFFLLSDTFVAIVSTLATTLAPFLCTLSDFAMGGRRR
jgi:hypothetical protein